MPPPRAIGLPTVKRDKKVPIGFCANLERRGFLTTVTSRDSNGCVDKSVQTDVCAETLFVFSNGKGSLTKGVVSANLLDSNHPSH